MGGSLVLPTVGRGNGRLTRIAWASSREASACKTPVVAPTAPTVRRGGRGDGTVRRCSPTSTWSAMSTRTVRILRDPGATGTYTEWSAPRIAIARRTSRSVWGSARGDCVECYDSIGLPCTDPVKPNCTWYLQCQSADAPSIQGRRIASERAPRELGIRYLSIGSPGPPQARTSRRASSWISPVQETTSDGDDDEGTAGQAARLARATNARPPLTVPDHAELKTGTAATRRW